MPQSEQLEVLVLGSGAGGKLIAWHMAKSGRRTAVVERHWIGGSCPNIACMPSKNEIASAKVAQLARTGGRYGTVTGAVTVDMATVRQRKREMVERQIAKHLQIYRASGAELARDAGLLHREYVQLSDAGGGLQDRRAGCLEPDVGGVGRPAPPLLPRLRGPGQLESQRFLPWQFGRSRLGNNEPRPRMTPQDIREILAPPDHLPGNPCDAGTRVG